MSLRVVLILANCADTDDIQHYEFIKVKKGFGFSCGNNFRADQIKLNYLKIVIGLILHAGNFSCFCCRLLTFQN